MLGIVIPTFNRQSNLRLVLKALAQQTEQRFLVVIADDGSTDGTRQLIESIKQTKQWRNRLQWINCGKNEGFQAGRARNIGVANLNKKCSLICFIDSDIVLHHKAIHYFKLAHQKFPNAIIMGTVQWLPSISVDKLSKCVAERTTETVLTVPDDPPRRIIGTFVGREIRDQIEVDLFSDELNQETSLRPELAITACIGYPSKLFHLIGGFDEKITGYGYEDIDLGLSAQKANATAILFSKIRAFHIWHPKANLDKVMASNQKNLEYILKKHGPHPILIKELDVLCKKSS